MPPVCRRRPAIRAPTPGPIPVPTPVALPNDLFKEFMQIFMEKTQAPAVPTAPAPDVEVRDNTDRPQKSRNPDLYYVNSHIQCYYFYQQYKDHFEVAGSLSHKCESFTAGFLKDRILNRWQQHKTRMQCNWLASMIWDEFKAFLRKSLGESNAFVGHVWSKLRGDA